MKRIIATILGLTCWIAGCRTAPEQPERDGYAALAEVSFYSVNVPFTLAEYADAHGGTLPPDMDGFVSWQNGKDREAQWSAQVMSQKFDVQWGTTVTNLTWAMYQKPPRIITYKSNLLRRFTDEANRRLIEGVASEK